MCIFRKFPKTKEKARKDPRFNTEWADFREEMRNGEYDPLSGVKEKSEKIKSDDEKPSL